MVQWQIEGKIVAKGKLTIHTNIYTGSSEPYSFSHRVCTMYVSLTNVCTARYSYLSSVQLNRTSFVLYRNILFYVCAFFLAFFFMFDKLDIMGNDKK